MYKFEEFILLEEYNIEDTGGRPMSVIIDTIEFIIADNLLNIYNNNKFYFDNITNFENIKYKYDDVKKIKNEYEEEVEESYTGPKPSSTPKSSPKPPDCLQNNNVFIFIICFFLILIIILILCFYGDLRSSTAPQRRLR